MMDAEGRAPDSIEKPTAAHRPEKVTVVIEAVPCPSCIKSAEKVSELEETILKLNEKLNGLHSRVCILKLAKRIDDDENDEEDSGKASNIKGGYVDGMLSTDGTRTGVHGNRQWEYGPDGDVEEMISKLVEELGSGDKSRIRLAMESSGNLLSSPLSEHNYKKLKEALSVICRQLYDANPLVYTTALSALSHICEDDLQSVIDAGVCSRLMYLLRNEDLDVVDGSLCIIRKISGGTYEQIKIFLDPEQQGYDLFLLMTLKDLLMPHRYGIVTWEHACAILGNITAKKKLIKIVVEAELIPVLIRVFGSDDVTEITRAHALQAVGRAITIVDAGVISSYCDLLGSGRRGLILSAVAGLGQIGLEGRGNSGVDGCNPCSVLMTACKGIEKLTDLIGHEDGEISGFATAAVDAWI